MNDPRAARAAGDPPSLRVLYSFPHKIGADRICSTAWHQVTGIARAGAQVVAFPGVVARPLPPEVRVKPTLSLRSGLRIPYRILGRMNAFDLHDRIVAARLSKLRNDIDVVHAWPLAALRTLQTAARLGIPAVLERPNAHTATAYALVQQECDRVGVALPPDHEHAYKADVLHKEEAEYEQATALLCPSEFVKRTFIERGFPSSKLKRHQYGFDPREYFPGPAAQRSDQDGLNAIFVGGCAPRKGLHYALQAWLASSACRTGRLVIVGGFVPGYRERLASMLSHPSVHVLGHRTDVAELMRTSDLLVLPSVEEGSALVTSEARGCGCVLLVSDAAGALCEHGVDSLVHRATDVESLTRHFSMVDRDRGLLRRLRERSLRSVQEASWETAGRRLLDAYRQVVRDHRAATVSSELLVASA